MIAAGQARTILARWVDDYNTERPHSSLGYATPAAFAAELEKQRAGLTPPVASPALTKPIASTALMRNKTARRQSQLVESWGSRQAEQNAASVVYDQLGNITEGRQIAKPGSGLADIVETAYYGNHSQLSGDLCYWAACYKPIWTRDALGRQTDYSWSTSHGGLLTRLEPADADGTRRKTINEYSGIRLIRERVCLTDAAGVEVTCGTAAEQVRQFTYWGATLLPLTETATDGAATQSLTTAYSYDTAGRVLSADGPLAGTDDATYYRYDISGRRTWEIGPADVGGVRQAKRFTYRDSDDKVTAIDAGYVTDPNATSLTQTLSRIDTSYGIARMPIRQKTSSGGTTIQLSDTSYDARNRPLCSTVRMNAAVFATVTGDACVAGAAGTQGPDRIAKTVYDNEGRVIQLRKAVGTPIEQAYATYSYTANGKQEFVIDANGNRAKMDYDGFDRAVKWTFPSTTKPAAYNPATQATALASAGNLNSGDYEQYGYDANGNRTSYRKRDSSTLTYAYDNLNRNIVKIVPERAGLAATHTRDVYTGYDVRNMPLYVRFDSAGAASDGLTYSYDSLGRQLTAALKMDGVTRTLTYGWDAAGRRSSVKHPDNQQFDYAYDGAARVTHIKQAATVLTGFTYNNLGLAATMTTGVATSYGYDTIGRLTSLGHDLAGTTNDVAYTLGYNAASQLASRTLSNVAYSWPVATPVDRTYTANGLNQYTAAGPASFTYDANGNLTSDGSTGFVYDIENRLVGASGAKTAALRYDPLGRLYETVGGSPSVTTRFLYDGDELVGEYDAAGILQRRYVHGAGVDDPVIWYEGSTIAGTALRRLRTNWQGSVVAVADNAGALIGANSYDDYGIPAAGNIGRFQYTGQAWLPEIGLYYYKARIYSPTLGRFLQTDPIGYEDQMNLYAYVANDPINGVDPTGMAGCADMADQGLSGDCFDASNFKESKADTSQNIVSTPEADAAVSAAGPNYAVNDAERGFRVDGSNVSPAGTPVDQGATSTVEFQRSELKGADAFGHSHPENVNASESQTGLIRGPGTDGANPGPGDGGATLQAGIPNYITHQGRTVVIEVSGGQARVRVISGSVNRTERGLINTRLRSMQRSMQ